MNAFVKDTLIEYPPGGDLAIIKLHEPVTITPFVQPICMPFGDQLTPGDVCYATGWGETRGTGGAEVLKQLQLTIEETCVVHAGNDVFDNSTMVCAVNNAHANGPCAGDSGSPLNCKHDDGKWYLHGITSMVTNNNKIKVICGLGDEGTIYNRVNTKLGWVSASIKYLHNN